MARTQFPFKHTQLPAGQRSDIAVHPTQDDEGSSTTRPHALEFLVEDGPDRFRHRQRFDRIILEDGDWDVGSAFSRAVLNELLSADPFWLVTGEDDAAASLAFSTDGDLEITIGDADNEDVAIQPLGAEGTSAAPTNATALASVTWDASKDWHFRLCFEVKTNVDHLSLAFGLRADTGAGECVTADADEVSLFVQGPADGGSDGGTFQVRSRNNTTDYGSSTPGFGNLEEDTEYIVEIFVKGNTAHFFLNGEEFVSTGALATGDQSLSPTLAFRREGDASPVVKLRWIDVGQDW